MLVGYGTQKKESLTSAITSVRSEDVTKTKQNDVITALQGNGANTSRFYNNSPTVVIKY